MLLFSHDDVASAIDCRHLRNRLHDVKEGSYRFRMAAAERRSLLRLAPEAPHDEADSPEPRLPLRGMRRCSRSPTPPACTGRPPRAPQSGNRRHLISPDVVAASPRPPTLGYRRDLIAACFAPAAPFLSACSCRISRIRCSPRLSPAWRPRWPSAATRFWSPTRAQAPSALELVEGWSPPRRRPDPRYCPRSAIR